MQGYALLYLACTRQPQFGGNGFPMLALRGNSPHTSPEEGVSQVARGLGPPFVAAVWSVNVTLLKEPVWCQLEAHGQAGGVST